MGSVKTFQVVLYLDMVIIMIKLRYQGTKGQLVKETTQNSGVLIFNSYLLRRYKASKGVVLKGKEFQAIEIKLNATKKNRHRR